MFEGRTTSWAVLLIILSAGWATAETPSLILVTIDTLRADRIGRQPRSLTPHIDKLAADGVRFERAMAQVPITLPSHVSIMTGSLPLQHGIRDFGGIRLKDEHVTLAEALHDKGYRNAAFVSSFALDSTWGLDQGFDLYHDEFDLSGYKGIGFNAVERPADQTVDLVLKWLEQDVPTPFFLWVHLFDPHDPYDPPEPFKTNYAGRLYDGEVAFADAQLGRLLQALRSRRLYDSSMIVVMGDHGEGLGEHGEETHGFFVYNSTLHVPLILKFPDGKFAGQSVSEVVQSTDVAPTVLQTLGIRRPPQWQGRGLLGLIRNRRLTGPERSYGESFYARYHFGWSSLTSFQDGKFKFIRAPRKELYDLNEDPKETRNLYQSRTALAEQYNNLLDQMIGKYKTREGDADQKHGEMDEETRRRLQSLGYVTTASGSNLDLDDVDRADPKDKFHLFAEIRKATLATEKGLHSESAALLSKVIQEDPGIYSARYLQGFNHFQGGQYMAAVNEFKEALKIFPDSPDAIHSLASSYLKLGLDDSALPGFERLSQLEPQRSRGYLGQARILLRKKQFPAAEVIFRKTIEAGDDLFGRLGLGRALVAQERFDEGLEQFRMVASRYPASAEAHLLLAFTFRKKGMPEEAKKHERIYRRLGGTSQ